MDFSCHDLCMQRKLNFSWDGDLVPEAFNRLGFYTEFKLRGEMENLFWLAWMGGVCVCVGGVGVRIIQI